MEPCDDGKWEPLAKRPNGRIILKGYPEESSPVIEVFDTKPELSPEAEEYLAFNNKTYEEWIKEEGSPIVHASENAMVSSWVKKYDNEDPRLHWIKQKVMNYFNIATPQTFLQLLLRSNGKYLKKILRFIERPIKKENLNNNLWFFITKQTVNVTMIAEVSWQEDISQESLAVKKIKLVSSNSQDSSVKSGKSKSKKKKKDEPQGKNYVAHNAQIPIVYDKIISQIHLHSARRPLGQIIKVNFLGFSRIPIKKHIPKFKDTAECESDMSKYVKEMKVGRITKPDERVVVQQCLENRPRVRQFYSILKDSMSEYTRNSIVKSYLKVDFRIQWLKEKLLNFFEIENPTEFYKMCTRHGGLSRNKILEFINTKYDPTDNGSFHQVMFVYTSKYARTYYKFVKFKLEKEELEPFVELEMIEDEINNSEGNKTSVGPTISPGSSIPTTPVTTTKTKDDITVKDGKNKKPKKKKPRIQKPRKKMKKMKLVRVKYEAAVPVKFKKEVIQMHLHHGPLISMNRSWRDKQKVLCVLRKNNPFQYIPQFDTYEEALAEMPKYVLFQSFEINGLLNHLYNTAELSNQFLNKQVGEPLFPSVINKSNGTSLCLPGTIAKRDFLVETHLKKIPFPWKYITSGPVIYQEYLYEKRCWPGTCDTNISMESKEQVDIYKAVEMRQDINFSNKLERNSSKKFLCGKWLNSFNHIHDFNNMEGKERETFIKSKVIDSSMAYASAIGKPREKVQRMHLFSKVKKLIKIRSIPANVELMPDEILTVEKLPMEPTYERIKMVIFDPKKFQPMEKEIQQKIYRNFSRLPQEYITKVASKIIEKNNYVENNPFKMQIVKRERPKLPQIKTNLKSLKSFTKRLYKNSQYPNKLCVPHWREILEKYLKEYEGLQKATEVIFSQKEYTKKDMEFRTILFQYIRKLYWFCREKMPGTYGPFTLYRYWKLRELVTFPFIRQCFGSHTIKFMLTHYYYNNKYYFDQFNKQFPFLIKVHKRAKYYCHMLKGFIIMLKNFRHCNSIDELSPIVSRFWGFLRNYWATSHFLSYQEIFCWALSYVSKTLVGKIKAIVKVDYLLSIPVPEAEKALLEVLFLMKLWKDEFSKSFFLCINDKGGYQQVLVLLEDDIFQSTVNVTKICSDLLKLLKCLMYFTNVFNADLALSVTEPQLVYYWREMCIESVRKITDYDIFDLENDKKWDHLQMEWHKNYKKMERQSMRLLKDLSKKIKDPALIAHYVNTLSPKDTSKKLYFYSLRMLEKSIDKIMDDMKDRFVMYLKNGNSLHDYFAHRNGPIPTGGIMWMQRYLVVFLYQFKSVMCGDKILEVIKQDKDIGIKLRLVLKEFKDFVSAIELIAYTQEIYIRDFVLLRSITGASVRIQCSDPGPLKSYYLENEPTYRFNLSNSRYEAVHTSSKADQHQTIASSFRKARNTFQFLDNTINLEEVRYCDNNPPEVKTFFFNMQHKKNQIQDSIIHSFNRFLEGMFSTIKTFQNVKETKINMNFMVYHMFLKKGRLSSSFIPINYIKKHTSPYTIFEIDSNGRYIYINSPHGELNKISSMRISLRKNYSVDESYKKTKYKNYKKIISDNVLDHFNINYTLSANKNVRYDPEIVYTIIKNFNIRQNEELQQLIEEPTYEVIRYHMSFFLLVFLREMLNLEDLNICKNDLHSNTDYKENCDVDLNKTLTGDEELMLTINIFTKMTQEQLEKLYEIEQKFEQIFLRELIIVKKMDSIIETDLTEGKMVSNKFIDDSDSLPSNYNKVLLAGNNSIEGTNSNEIVTSVNDYVSSNFYDRFNINSYQYFNSYFEDIENVEDDAFGVLIQLSNLIIFKDNDFIDLKRCLEIKSETTEPAMGFQYNPIHTTQDRRALPLRGSADVEKDWDFLTNFIFETQGDIIRHFVLKPEEFNMRLYGKDLYSEDRETHLLTNRAGQRNIYAYPIMMDKNVQNRVCKLSDRYYSEKKRVQYISDSESEEIPTEKVHRKVELIYEPITGWGSDESVPGDFFPQRWIDMNLKDYVQYDPCGREAAQQMLLFKKTSSTSDSDKKIAIEEVDDKNVSIDRIPIGSIMAKNDKILKKEKIYEIHHNFNSKNKNVLFEPIDDNFVCYAINGSTSEISFDGSKPALDGEHHTNKNQITDINKLTSKRVGNWCNTLNYYNDNKKLLPFIEKFPEWISYQSQKQNDVSKLKRKSKRSLLTPSSSIQFSNECNISSKSYKEQRIMGFPHPETFPHWATHWPKPGEMSLNSKPALDKIARSFFLRQKFVDPGKIKLLNSFYKYYYYKAKKPFIPKETHYENYLSRWKVHKYFTVQKKYRAIAQNYLNHFLKCPKMSTKYLDRLFSAHSIYLFRKYGADNELAPTLINTLNQLSNGEQIKKIDKFLYGIYNVLPVNAKLEKLNHWFDNLQNEQADLLRPATSQLAIRLKTSAKASGNIPFFIPTKFLHYFMYNLKEKPLPLLEDDNRLSELVHNARRLSEEENDNESSHDSFQRDKSLSSLIQCEPENAIQNAISSWKNVLHETPDEELTVANIERRLYDILQNTNYHKRCAIKIKLPSNFLEPYSQNRNMLHTFVNTDEDYRWRYDLEFTALTWQNLKETINAYNTFLHKLKTESEEDLYFMRSFLKQMDIRMMVVLRSYLLYKRIPMRSKRFIVNGSQLFDDKLRQLREVLNNIISPAWDYIKNCRWFEGLDYDAPFQTYLETNRSVRDAVQSNLLYTNRLFYHNFKVLHYVMHGDWPPGFVNNFRFFKHFEYYELKRVEYSIRNLEKNTDLFIKTLLRDSVTSKEWKKEVFDCDKKISSMEIRRNSILEEVESFLWYKGRPDMQEEIHIGQPILRLIYKYGDIRFYEPIEKWLLELWLHYINGYTHFTRWMAGTCENTSIINIISKNHFHSYSIFDEFMKYHEPKRYLVEGIKSIIGLLNSINAYRKNWKVFYNLWSTTRRYKIRYNIIHEDLPMAEVDKALRYITEVIKQLSEISLVSFGFIKIDLREFIQTQMIKRCEKLKSAICYGVVKRIKMYMNAFSNSIYELLKTGDNFILFIHHLDNFSKAKELLRNFNIGVMYAREASEVLAHSNIKFSSTFLKYIRLMEAILQIGRTRIQIWRLQKYYYQKHFESFIEKFKAKCAKFATKWWNEGPRNMGNDLPAGLDLISWYRKTFRDIRVKQKKYYVMEQKLNIFIVSHYYFEHSFIDYRNQETLYAYYRIYQDYYKNWIKQYWQYFNLSDILNDFEPLKSSFEALEYGVKNSQIGVKIYDLISKDYETLMIIRRMKDETVKDRHWDSLKIHTQYDINLNDAYLKLIELFNWNLWKYSDFINELLLQASSEDYIFKRIKKLSYASVDCKLDVLPYYDDGRLIGFILDTNDRTKKRIKKYIKGFKKLAESMYSALYMNNLNTWIEILSFSFEVLSDWLKVQNKWSKLKLLALSGDLEDELPDVAAIFGPIDKEYLKMTSILNRKRGVITQTMKRGIVKKFYQFSEALNECLTMLLTFIETSENLLPVFQLISKSELRSIINEVSEECP